MLGLVAAQLKYKVENKELQAGKAIWVDVRHLGIAYCSQMLTLVLRSAEALGKSQINPPDSMPNRKLATTLKPWLLSYPLANSSRTSTLSTCLPLFAMLPVSDLSV